MPRYIDADAINMSDISPVDGFSVFGLRGQSMKNIVLVILTCIMLFILYLAYLNAWTWAY